MSSDNSSIGEAVSGRGVGDHVEEEDLYYIPERRPSLDLGTTPVDTSQWYKEIFDVLTFIVLCEKCFEVMNHTRIVHSLKAELVAFFLFVLFRHIIIDSLHNIPKFI